MNYSKWWGVGLMSAALLGVTMKAAKSDAATPPVPPTQVAPLVLLAGKATGEVRLQLTIDETGKPRNIRLFSIVDRMLEEQLRKAVSQWRFTPATREGRAVSAEIILPLRLAESDKATRRS